MKPFQWAEDMNEVSGFGGYYERCCRTAITAGADWCLQNPHADPSEIEKAIGAALVTRDDGSKVPLQYELTSTQMGVAMHHVRYIAEHGWEKYRETMSAPLKVYE